MKSEVEDSKLLELLANAIIPADEVDAGAACVGAAEILLKKSANPSLAPIYRLGLTKVREIIARNEGSTLEELTEEQLSQILEELKGSVPGFFKQLRMDVSAAYLGNEQVWKRIGFPGPSTLTGGYPDFDQPQSSDLKPRF